MRWVGITALWVGSGLTKPSPIDIFNELYYPSVRSLNEKGDAHEEVSNIKT
jgi:hypothetical protein